MFAPNGFGVPVGHIHRSIVITPPWVDVDLVFVPLHFRPLSKLAALLGILEHVGIPHFH